MISVSFQYVVVNPDDSIPDEVDPLAPEHKAFCELFSLPPTEFPLPGKKHLMKEITTKKFVHFRVYIAEYIYVSVLF